MAINEAFHWAAREKKQRQYVCLRWMSIDVHLQEDSSIEEVQSPHRMELSCG